MVSEPIIVILGGYGNTGRALAPLLLEHTNARLVLAGRNVDKACAAARALNERHPGERCTAARADAADGEGLRQLFAGADVAVVASSTSMHVDTVAAACLAAGVDYLDPNYSTAKLAALRKLEPRIIDAGRCFVTDAGFHPGLPALLVRRAAQALDSVCAARVGSVIQIDWRELSFSPETIEELVTEFREYLALDFRGGRWRRMGWWESFRPMWMTFGHGFGRRYTMPMFLEELRPLPERVPGLADTGFYVGGFNAFVDWVLLPAGMAALWLTNGRGGAWWGRALAWGLRTFSRPPYGTLLQLEARGQRDGVPTDYALSVYHGDGYVLTAAPMAACLLQVLDGSARRPGLHFQAWLPEPARMLTDLGRMGVSVTETTRERS
jgi:saccharopine dehydrogenase (NAD+, L-lysine-forming)